ncbi:lamin tail domain-containing protein [Amycolatopsis samaneae]|uniref:Lamin tail domain-containing protein n=1 Tax=Amycolatopsis samaneae TaxID=664691 RepID=A0ABW5GPD0_9PSEU
MRKGAAGVLATLAAFTVAPAAVAAPRVSTTVVINEVSTRGPGGELDEFLELRNISTVPQDLSTFQLKFFSPTCAILRTIVLPAGLVLSPANSPGQFLVATNQGFSGTVEDPTNVLMFAVDEGPGLLPSQAGALALVSPTGQRVDALAWAAPLTSTCRQEGNPARTPPPLLDASMSRDFLSTDTDDNLRDFSLQRRSPGAP